MDEGLKAAHQKLSFLQLAKSLRNVRKACRLRGVSWILIYEYKRRFEAYGIEEMKEPPLIPKFNPSDYTFRAGCPPPQT